MAPDQPQLPPAQPEESAISRREKRSQLVQKIVKYLPLGGVGVGISAIVTLLKSGNYQGAMISGLCVLLKIKRF